VKLAAMPPDGLMKRNFVLKTATAQFSYVVTAMLWPSGA